MRGFLVTARGGSGIVIANLDDGIINSGMRGFLGTARGGSGIVITKLDDGIINSGIKHYRDYQSFRKSTDTDARVFYYKWISYVLVNG